MDNQDRLDLEGKDKFGAPDYIYLQLHGDSDPDLEDDPFVDCTQDVSWCWEMIYEFDVEYVRLDIHKKQIESLTSELEKEKLLNAPGRKIQEKLEKELEAAKNERDRAWQKFDTVKFALDKLEAENAELKPYKLASPFKDAAIKGLEAENIDLKQKLKEAEGKLEPPFTKEEMEDKTVCHTCDGTGFSDSAY